MGSPATSSPAGAVAGGGPIIDVKTLSDGGIEFTVAANPQSTRTLVIRNQSLAPGQVPEGQASHGPERVSAAGGSAIRATFVEGQADPCKVVDSPAQ
jgi:hypothetical protein